MAFKLTDLQSKVPSAKPVSAAATTQSGHSSKAAPDAVSSLKVPNVAAVVKEPTSKNSPLPLPFQVSHFVIYRDGIGKVQMVQKRSEEEAQAFKEALDNGFIGN